MITLRLTRFSGWIALVVTPLVFAQEPTRELAPRKATLRPEISGQLGVVAAGRHYTVAAGIRILEQGGNATDAGAAAVFAAAVTEFDYFGLGGEVPLLIYDSSAKKVVVVNGQGTAPAAATPALFAAKGYVEGNGPLGATVPAVVDALVLALQHHGTLRLEQILAPAIEYADGFPLYAALRSSLLSQRKATEQWEWSRRTYYPEGRVPAVGELFRQPNLATTLRAIVAAEKAEFAKSGDRIAAIQAGRDFFYKGEIARKIAAAQKEAGGVMTYDDLANYRGKIEEPVSTTFHGYTVYKAGFWNQGPALLQTLNILEGVDLAKLGFLSADYVHTVTEAIKLAYADRNTFYGDPAFASVPARGLLSKEYANERRRLIGSTASLEHRAGDPYAFDSSVPRPAQRYTPHPQGQTDGKAADTTAIEVVDRNGNLFSATPSSGWILRGAFIAGDTGVPLGNRMTVFDLDPLSPNLLVGGKRPRTTLTPTIVLKDGKPFLAIGTPGGDNQDQQILNVLLGVTVFGLGLQESIEAPRLNSEHFHGSFFQHQDKPGVLEIEDRVPASVRDELTARGHKLKVLGPWGVSTGVVAVGVRPGAGTLFGAADPRRERYVFGW